MLLRVLIRALEIIADRLLDSDQDNVQLSSEDESRSKAEEEEIFTRENTERMEARKEAKEGTSISKGDNLGVRDNGDNGISSHKRVCNTGPDDNGTNCQPSSRDVVSGSNAVGRIRV